MPELDRAAIIELLERLGDDSDEVALQAGRELHAHVRDAGLTWDELLLPAPGDEPLLQDDDLPLEDESGLEPEDTIDTAAVEPETDDPGDPGDPGEDARIIERLLARKDLSADLREELSDFRRDVADGALAPMDRRYIRALAARLGA